MENTCNLLCPVIFNINWIWFAVAVIVTFGVGAVWHSLLFAKAWIRVFKVEMPEKVTTSSFIRTMSVQFIGNILYGFVFFILTGISVWLAIIALIGFCGWEKGFLNFQFAKIKDFMMASLIRVGYTFVAGLIFILFALI
jgi:hypothetical protein